MFALKEFLRSFVDKIFKGFDQNIPARARMELDLSLVMIS